MNDHPNFTGRTLVEKDIMVRELELLRLIDLIYQGALDAGRWAEAIATVGRAFGSEVSSLSLYEPPSRALR